MMIYYVALGKYKAEEDFNVGVEITGIFPWRETNFKVFVNTQWQSGSAMISSGFTTQCQCNSLFLLTYNPFMDIIWISSFGVQFLCSSFQFFIDFYRPKDEACKSYRHTLFIPSSHSSGCNIYHSYHVFNFLSAL